MRESHGVRLRVAASACAVAAVVAAGYPQLSPVAAGRPGDARPASAPAQLTLPAASGP